MTKTKRSTSTSSAGRPGLSTQQARRVMRYVRAICKLADGNKTAAAAKIGITASAVSQLLVGKNRPSFRTAEKVAKASGLEVAALLAGTA